MTKTLQEIENSLAVLWTQDAPRLQFLKEKKADGIDDEISTALDPRGVRLYANLIKTGRHDLMQSIYPGCKKILSRSWTKLVDQYFETCPPGHYNLNRAAQGFSEFLKLHTPELVTRHGFLPELADYEWVELEIMESDVVVQRGINLQLDSPEKFQKYGPILNSVLIVRNYNYPITKLVDWLRDDVRLPRRVKKDKINLAIYRDPEELNARFLELGELAAKMIEILGQRQLSYADLIAFAVSECQSKDPQQTVVKTLELFEELDELQVFVGSRKLDA